LFERSIEAEGLGEKWGPNIYYTVRVGEHVDVMW